MEKTGGRLKEYYSGSPGEMFMTWARMVEVGIERNGHLWDIFLRWF